MKKVIIVLLISFTVHIICSCGEYDQTIVGNVEKTVNNSIAQTDSYDTFKFPINERRIYAESLAKDELIKNSNYQYIFKNNAEASLLAWKIQPFILNNKSALEDFNGIDNADIKTLKFIAILQTPTIIIQTAAIDSNGKVYERDYLKEHPDHTITKLYKEITYINSVWYTDDIKETLIYLFGDKNPKLLELNEDIQNKLSDTGERYCYNKIANVFYTQNTIVYDNGSTEIISYEKTDKGYVCEAVIAPYLENLYIGDETVKITADNYEEYLKYMAKYQFTFIEAEDDGRLLLNGQQTLYIP